MHAHVYTYAVTYTSKRTFPEGEWKLERGRLIFKQDALKSELNWHEETLCSPKKLFKSYAFDR